MFVPGFLPLVHRTWAFLLHSRFNFLCAQKNIYKKAMARTKSQPVQRQTSSEYIAGQPRTTSVKEAKDGLMQQQQEPNGATAPAPVAKPEAGLPQLVIAVAGIYASLCVQHFLLTSLPTLSTRCDAMRCAG